MLIRPMTGADIAPLAYLMATTPLWQRYGVTAEQAATRLHDGLVQEATIVVAERAQQVLGFVWYITRGAFQRGGYIMLIGVTVESRNQGVGAALMAYAEQKMFAEIDTIFLLVSDFNLAAHRFYQQLGYQQIGTIPDFMLPGVAELIFYKRRLAKIYDKS